MSWWNNDNNNNNNNNNSGWGSTSNSWGSSNNNNNSNSWGSSTSWGSNTNSSNNTTNTNSNNNNNNSTSWNNNNNNNSSNASQANPNNDTIVANPPNDAITCLRFNPSHDLFAVSSWNNSIVCYQYQFENNSLIKTRSLSEQKADRGILCCCWDGSGSTLFSGACDSTIRIWNVEKSSFITLGNHNAGIKCIEFASDFNMLISGSWDRTLVYWDIRSGQKVTVLNLPAKVFCSGLRGYVLCVGLSNKYVQSYDLRKHTQYMTMEKTVLKHQLRCMDVFPDMKGFVCASIEGRTAIKHFEKFDQKNDFSFKCHRHQRGSDKHSQDVFAVNCLRFNQQFGTFASGGDDGQINIWDKEGRSRVKHFEQIKKIGDSSTSNDTMNSFWSCDNNKANNSFMPITSLDFNKTGRVMAYATSYNWNKGISYYDQKNHSPQIYLHVVQQKEVDANWTKNNN